MTPRNQDLYTAMKRFCLAITEELDHQEDSINGPASSKLIEDARELPEYRRCIETLNADSVISSHFEKRIGIAGFGYTPVAAKGLLDALVIPVSEGKRPVLMNISLTKAIRNSKTRFIARQ